MGNKESTLFLIIDYFYLEKGMCTVFWQKNLIPSIKHGGGSIMAWVAALASCH